MKDAVSKIDFPIANQGNIVSLIITRAPTILEEIRGQSLGHVTMMSRSPELLDLSSISTRPLSKEEKAKLRRVNGCAATSTGRSNYACDTLLLDAGGNKRLTTID
jgi:hypothetical protein